MPVQGETERPQKPTRQSTSAVALLMVFLILTVVLVASYFRPIPLFIGGRGVVFGCQPPFPFTALTAQPSWVISRGGREGIINLFTDLDGQKDYLIVWVF